MTKLRAKRTVNVPSRSRYSSPLHFPVVGTFCDGPCDDAVDCSGRIQTEATTPTNTYETTHACRQRPGVKCIDGERGEGWNNKLPGECVSQILNVGYPKNFAAGKVKEGGWWRQD